MRDALLALLLAIAAVPAMAADNQDYDQIARGRYLTVMGDCQVCHTATGGAPFAGGRPIETPFGTILSSNITPDPDTGIGAWSDHDVLDALQKGRGRNGQHIYPAMPYTYTAHTTRADVLAIRAYIATLTPVHHAVDANTLPFPFNIRAMMGVWNWLYFDKGSFHPRPDRDAEWNRGAYLVTGLEHCGMCHTPKTLLGGDRTAQALQGYRLQGWFAPEISGDARRGLGRWSVDDIVAYLRTGHNRFAAASGPMAEEVGMSSRHEDAADLRAIAVYLKDQPGSGVAIVPLGADRPDMKAGAAIYADLCSACHTPDGAGVDGLYPALAGSPSVQSRDPASIIRVILRGARSVSTPGAPTGPAMSSFAWTLDDVQVAAVATYIRNSWGNAAPAVTAARVHDDRASLANRPTD